MKKKLQGLILVVGLIGSTFAFATTPTIRGARVSGVIILPSPVPIAGARGGGVLALAVFAFGGVTIMFKDD